MAALEKPPGKAMILAAGLGTRLRPLTGTRPKALVELNGRTLLEIALTRLRRFGVREVIVNVHHFADRVVDYLRAHDNFGMRVEISREDDELLDTGGGLLKAADFFLRDSAPGAADAEPFLLHNVDVLSTIDLGEMVKLHRRENALATLAIQQRESSRCLLFDQDLRLCGRRTAGKPDELACNAPRPQAWAFAGIHVLSPRIFELMNQEPPRLSRAFSIIPEYLRLAGEGEKLLGFPAPGSYWRDLGTAASLQQAAEDLRRGLVEP